MDLRGRKYNVNMRAQLQGKKKETFHSSPKILSALASYHRAMEKEEGVAGEEEKGEEEEKHTEESETKPSVLSRLKRVLQKGLLSSYWEALMCLSILCYTG